MKILLLGEYSGVHNNLRKALKEDGHEVCLVSDGDSYKDFSSDVLIHYKLLESNNSFLNKVFNIYNLILVYMGLNGCFQILKHWKTIKEMRDYDIVQLINPIFLSGYGSIVNILVFKYLIRHNGKIFLCALGDDLQYVSYCLDNKFNYSFFNQLSVKTLRYYLRPLMYLYGAFYPTLNKLVLKEINAVIPGLYDYYAAYKDNAKCSEIVPIIIPSNESTVLKTDYPIIIFHGWQTGRTFQKGNDIFDQAIKKLLKKYPSKVEYKVINNLPYKEYIESFTKSHIFIDQCYSQDCGVNALLGMSAGKVVFSGFEKSVQNYYKITSPPLINATPNVDKIYLELEKLIDQPHLIANYSHNAINFILKYHNSKYVLEKYYRIWNS